jgi:hypothetical protein
MAQHTEAQIISAAQRMRAAVDIARRRLEAGLDAPGVELALAG